MPYPSESAFVQTFVRALKTQTTAFFVTAYGLEFSNGTSSRPDIIAVDKAGDVIAMEAKLERWRDAVSQAYRNTFFADRSYVLLPEAVARRAHMFSEEFAMRGIGLCTLVNGEIHVLTEAPKQDPHNIYRRELAREYAFAKRRIRR